jgi:aromatic ring hydroxylase
MCHDPQSGPGNSVMPKAEYASTLRLFSTMAWPRVKEIFETILGGAPIVTPSSYKDLKNSNLRPFFDQYYRGSDRSAEQRIKLFKLIWDAIGTEFGGRHELYERNYSGNNEQMRMDVLTFAQQRGIMEMCHDFAEQCMSDYDLNGWTSDDWKFDPLNE